MAKRRTRYQYENAKVYPTGQDIESAARAVLLARGLGQRLADRLASQARHAFERACHETDDPHDRAHGKVESGTTPGVSGWLLPPKTVLSARPRRYPRECLVEVRTRKYGARVLLVSVDTECESLGDRANRLNAAGIPVGYVGSVTGAQQQRARGPKDVETLAYVESIAAASGKTLRDLLRPTTRQNLTPRERELQAEATALIAEAERARKAVRS